MYSETNVRSNRFSVRTNNIPIKDLGEIRGTVALDLSEASRFRFTVIGNVTFITTNQSVSDDIEFLFVNEGFTITYPSNFNVTNVTNTSYVNIVTRFTKNGGQWTETYYKANTENPYVPYITTRNIRATSVSLSCNCCLNNLTCYTVDCSTLNCCAGNFSYRLCACCRNNGSVNAASYDHCWILADSGHTNIYCLAGSSLCWCTFGLLINNSLPTQAVPVAINLPNNEQYLTACVLQSRRIVGVSDAGRLYSFTTCINFGTGASDGFWSYCIHWNYLCCRNPSVPLLAAATTSPCSICCLCAVESIGCCRWCSTPLGATYNDDQAINPSHYFRWFDKCTAAYTYAFGATCCTGCTGACASPRTMWIRDVPGATCVCQVQRTGIPLTKSFNCYYYINYACKVLNCHIVELICDANGGSCNVASFTQLITNTYCAACSTSDTVLPAQWAGSIITCDACYYLNFNSPIACDPSGCTWYRCCSAWFPTTCVNLLCVQVYCRCSGSGAFCTTGNNIATACWTDADNWRYVGTLNGYCNPTATGVSAYLRSDFNCGYSSNNYIQNIVVVCKCTAGLSIHGICFASGGFWTVSTCTYDCLATLYGCNFSCAYLKTNIGWTNIFTPTITCDSWRWWSFNLFLPEYSWEISCVPHITFPLIKNVCTPVNSYDCCVLTPNMNPCCFTINYGLTGPTITRFLPTGKPYGLQCNE